MDSCETYKSGKLRRMARIARKVLSLSLFLLLAYVALDARMKVTEARDVIAYSFAVARLARIRVPTRVLNI